MRFLLLLLLAGSLCAQPNTTQVIGPISDLTGHPFQGAILFTLQDVTSNGVVVYSPPITVCSPFLNIPNCDVYGISGGIITVTLVVNQSATPSGTSYTVTFTPYSGSPPAPRGSYVRYWSIGNSGPYTPAQVLTSASTVNPDLRGPPGAAGAASTVPGPPGTNGTNGVSATAAVEPPGANCAPGGLRITSASGTSYLCNGAVGLAGTNGQSVTVATESAGANCTYGGEKLTSASGTAYVCAGAPGSAGSNGANGNTILSGSLAPVSGTGNNGDWYIAAPSTAPCLYGPKASGSWPGSCINLVGPSGPGSGNMLSSVYDPAGKNSQLAAVSDLAAYAPLASPTFSGTLSAVNFSFTGTLNDVGHSGLATGLQKHTSGSGTWTIATAGVDYQGVITGAPGSWPAFTSFATLPTGTSAKVMLGNATLATLDTSITPENGNLYFTNGRAQAALSGLYQVPITGAPSSWPSSFPPIAPTTIALGGVRSIDCTGTGHVLSIDTSGVPHCSADSGGGGGVGGATWDSLGITTWDAI